jgi:hypothetical protein
VVVLVQAPARSQRGAVRTPAEQVAGPQGVALPGNWQAPAPLQMPPQVPVPVHSSVGSWPDGMLEQVPARAGRLQDWQRLVQAVAQQTPSAQEPERHCVAREHEAPGACAAAHVPALQKKPVEHSASDEHPDRHPLLVGLHVDGEQLV